MTEEDQNESATGAFDAACRRGVPDRYFPWTGEIERVPIGASWVFVVLVGLYAAGMLALVFATTPELSSRFILPIGAWITCMIVWAGISGIAVLRQSWRLENPQCELEVRDKLMIEGIPLVSFLLYPGPYVAYRLLVMERFGVVALFNQPLILVVVIQAAILCVIIGIVNSPLAPAEDAVPNDGPAKARHIELRLTNWWRSAQLAMTFFFAFGVGITASYYAQLTAGGAGRAISGLGLHVVSAMVGIIGLACYVIAKFRIIHGEYPDALGQS